MGLGKIRPLIHLPSTAFWPIFVHRNRLLGKVFEGETGGRRKGKKRGCRRK
jgi:hypothetical protein